jgi:hypothetical protein
LHPHPFEIFGIRKDENGNRGDLRGTERRIRESERRERFASFDLHHSCFHDPLYKIKPFGDSRSDLEEETQGEEVKRRLGAD